MKPLEHNEFSTQQLLGEIIWSFFIFTHYIFSLARHVLYALSNKEDSKYTVLPKFAHYTSLKFTLCYFHKQIMLF